MNRLKSVSTNEPHPFVLWKILSTSRFIFRRLGYFFLTLVLFTGLGYLILKSRPLPPPDTYAISSVYDEKGTNLGLIEAGNPREVVRLSKIPKHLIQATLTAEDRGFYHHIGFSPKAIIRATWENIKAGHIVQGASTITQQLAKNLYLSHDRTWTRKIKEAIYTLQLEIHYTKDQILEMYLNKVYYGHGAYGIGSAARLYFDKKVEELTLAESAFLSGIPRGPEHYSPYYHLSRAMDRQQQILAVMAETHALPVSTIEAAKHQNLSILNIEKPIHTFGAPYFRDYLVHEAVTQTGLDETFIRHGGLKIYTTLDMDLQRKAEEAVSYYLGDKKDLQGALLSVDPNTGYIKAMVGGKNYVESQYNRVFARRQPGSTFKPILYLHALEKGFTPLTQIVSRPTTFSYNGQIYRPQNFRNQYANRGITLREAIAHSDNIYAVSTQFQIGLGEEISTARKLGIQSPLNPTPSLALGSYPVTPFELTQAYATIASFGTYRPLIGITKITDSEGKTLFSAEKQEEVVISPSHTFVLTQLLTSVFDPGGTAYRVKQMFPNPVAGKTGSTNWDGWLSGFSPHLVTTVWVGYDKNQQISHTETRLAQYIWGRYMEKASPVYARFPAPPKGVVKVRIDTETGFIATPACKHTRVEYFVEGSEPTQTCPKHPYEDPNRSMWDRLVDWFTED